MWTDLHGKFGSRFNRASALISLRNNVRNALRIVARGASIQEDRAAA
jgi:hypothetical protein